MLTIPAVFVAGILAFLSPCFLPVVPVFVAQMTGRPRQMAFTGAPSTHTTTKEPSTRVNATLQAMTFVLSFSLVFAGLWAAVGVFGWVVGDIRQYLTIIAGAALILLGLHVARLIRLPLIDRTVRHGVSLDGGPSFRKSALLGVSFGAGWSPCIGPILGGVLALAMAQDTAASGLGLLFVFCAGLGLPFIACTVLADRALNFGWVKEHYKAIELVVGLSLVVIGFLMISGLLERLSAAIPAIM